MQLHRRDINLPVVTGQAELAARVAVTQALLQQGRSGGQGRAAEVLQQRQAGFGVSPRRGWRQADQFGHIFVRQHIALCVDQCDVGARCQFFSLQVAGQGFQQNVGANHAVALHAPGGEGHADLAVGEEQIGRGFDGRRRADGIVVPAALARVVIGRVVGAVIGAQGLQRPVHENKAPYRLARAAFNGLQDVLGAFRRLECQAFGLVVHAAQKEEVAAGVTGVDR